MMTVAYQDEVLSAMGRERATVLARSPLPPLTVAPDRGLALGAFSTVFLRGGDRIA